MPAHDAIPDCLRGLCEEQGVAVLCVDKTTLDKFTDVQNMLPDLLANHDDRQRLDDLALHEIQCFEELIQRAKSAGKHYERLRSLQEMQLANRKIMEMKTEAIAYELVRLLFVRKTDIQPDALRTYIARATISGFHDPGAAAGHQRQTAIVGALT